jgi:hypothetical protein
MKIPFETNVKPLRDQQDAVSRMAVSILIHHVERSSAYVPRWSDTRESMSVQWVQCMAVQWGRVSIKPSCLIHWHDSNMQEESYQGSYVGKETAQSHCLLQELMILGMKVTAGSPWTVVKMYLQRTW